MQNHKFLPGGNIPLPTIRKSLLALEAYHLCGYRIDGMPLGDYLYESLLLLREIVPVNKCNVIPLRQPEIKNVFEAYYYAIEKTKFYYNARIISLDFKKKCIILKHMYTGKIFKVTSDG